LNAGDRGRSWESMPTILGVAFERQNNNGVTPPKKKKRRDRLEGDEKTGRRFDDRRQRSNRPPTKTKKLAGKRGVMPQKWAGEVVQ